MNWDFFFFAPSEAHNVEDDRLVERGHAVLAPMRSRICPNPADCRIWVDSRPPILVTQCRVEPHKRLLAWPTQLLVSPIAMLNVIVTGGSSGIGYAAVAQFASQGHRVLATYCRHEGNLAELKALLPRVSTCQLDQGDLDSIELFAEVAKAWLALNEESGSRLHVLVNNAALGSATVQQYVDIKLQGQPPCSSLRRRALEDEALMRVNALGPLWVTEALQPMMTAFPSESKMKCARQYSTVLFVGSVGGSIGVFPEYRSSDLMSKAAVAYLAKQKAAENISTNIDVLCVAPGATDTEMFRKSTLDSLADPASFVRSMPKQRLLTPEEIAASIYALCTERWARAFHGGVLDASLGLGVRPGVQTETELERKSVVQV